MRLGGACRGTRVPARVHTVHLWCTHVSALDMRGSHCALTCPLCPSAEGLQGLWRVHSRVTIVWVRRCVHGHVAGGCALVRHLGLVDLGVNLRLRSTTQQRDCEVDECPWPLQRPIGQACGAIVFFSLSVAVLYKLFWIQIKYCHSTEAPLPVHDAVVQAGSTLKIVNNTVTLQCNT